MSALHDLHPSLYAIKKAPTTLACEGLHQAS
jgi:hypothetical protein